MKGFKVKKETVFELTGKDLNEISNFCESLGIIIETIIRRRENHQAADTNGRNRKTRRSRSSKKPSDKLLMDIF